MRRSNYLHKPSVSAIRLGCSGWVSLAESRPKELDGTVGFASVAPRGHPEWVGLEVDDDGETVADLLVGVLDVGDVIAERFTHCVERL